MPWYVETRLLYYRTDIAKKAGITEAPKTWDELKATARAMQDKGGAKYGINLSTNNWQEYLPFVWQAGGDLAKGDEFTLNSPQAAEATGFYKSFADEGLSPNTTKQGFDITPAFVRGTHPMFFSGPWHMGLIKEAGGKGFDKKWAVAPMPTKETNTSLRRRQPTGPSSSRPRTATRRGSSSSGCPSPRRRPSGTRSPATCRPTRPRGICPR